ncbi:HlyD family secretion protein [Paracoccus sp. MBLB3053]|uniref:HlyD family secretion protein n=1 Tax=Paracoccus aurantius TaxID=3073814 RepID=A0ABU2HYR4_9RHOB|nr:HlyD family secretion protein [Paracoccus sp. MBLB3053]MDS9470185.1 HlyD family secretion protein [Paracoccus sp. MBLB3053]
MNRFAGLAGRMIVTLAMVACALVLGHYLWRYYMDAPWTRDGRVRADVVGVASDVSGPVQAVAVRDNQLVAAGDALFQIDKARYQLALRTAQAAADSASAALTQAQADLQRYDRLAEKDVASQRSDEAAGTLVRQRQAELDTAMANRDLAQLDLDRTTVRASVNGRITNFSLRPGDYSSAGVVQAALIDTDSIHVAGYFEETQLHKISVGDPVRIRLMGGEAPITGFVSSLAGGIQDQERNDTGGDMANVTPTFAWVRLAQRVPVRIELDDPDLAQTLIVGRSATVEVLPPQSPATAQ